MNKLIGSALAASLMASTAALAQSPTPPAVEKDPSTSAAPSVTPAPAERMTPPSDSSTAAPSSRSDTAVAPSVSPSSDQTVLTEDQVKGWINKVVYSSDNKNLGEVAALARDSSGKVTELHADIGGFLGIGETRVRVMPSDFTLANDRVILKLTAEQAKSLPKLPKS